MSTNNSLEPLKIDRKASLFLAWFLLISHTLFLAVVPVLTLPIWMIIGVTIGVILSLISTMRNHALLQSRHAIVRLIWTNNNRWILAYANGVVSDAELIPNSFVNPHLVILNFQTTNAQIFMRRPSVVIAADSVDPNTFRRLRARLIVKTKNPDDLHR